MAFAVRNLSVLAYAQGFTLWHYRANTVSHSLALAPPALLDEISADGFFDPAMDMLALGDMILASAANGGRLLYVTGVDGGVCVGAMT